MVKLVIYKVKKLLLQNGGGGGVMFYVVSKIRINRKIIDMSNDYRRCPRYL